VNRFADKQISLQHPWAILFQINGSIWLSVLPYCILNCCLAYAVYLLKTNDIKLTFSASGHALMSLLVSYLVVSKVYLSLDRYMQARTFAGQTLMTLRELHQLVLTFSFAIPSDATDSTTVQKWRNKVCSMQHLRHAQYHQATPIQFFHFISYK
jgi:predicted membrane chloride channel (bestrophin family)